MVLDHWIFIAVVMVIGSLIQSIAGLGFGMFSVNALLFVGLQPYEAIPISSLGSLAQTIMATWRHRTELDWRLLARMVAVAAVALPVGVLTLHALTTTLTHDQVKQFFGVVLLAALAAQFYFRPIPRPKRHWGWLVAAMSISGLMSGMVGMAGPALVLWLISHTFSPLRIRVLLWAFFCALAPVQFVSLYLQFGPPVGHAAAAGALFLPLVLVASLPGLWIGKRLSGPTQRRLVLGILIMTALLALISPWLPKGGGLGPGTPTPSKDSALPR